MSKKYDVREEVMSFLDGEIDGKELSHRVSKYDFFDLPYEDFLLILGENDNLPPWQRLTSLDIIKEYGKRVTSTMLYDLIERGYVEKTDCIEIPRINRVLRLSGYEEDLMYSDEEVMGLYTPSSLFDMKEKGKLTPEFLDKYLQFADFSNNERLFKYKSEELVKYINNYYSKDKTLSDNIRAEKIKDDILEFYRLGLCAGSVAKEAINAKDIQNRFLNGDIEMEEISQFYGDGFLDDGDIAEYYSEEEVIDLYKQNDVSIDALRTIKNSDLLLQKYSDNEIDFDTMMSLYFDYDILSVDDLEMVLALTDSSVDVSRYITSDTSFKKIKELFANLIIDYSAICAMQRNRIISEDEFKELKGLINTREFYDNIKAGKKFRVVTNREEKRPTPISGPKEKEDEKEDSNYESEIELISRVVGIDLKTAPYSLIESINAKGRATSLNNYQVFANEEKGIVVLRKSAKENAIFVMPVEQMVYFLKGEENEEGEIEIQNRMKDKAHLRSIDGVIPVEHNEFFARNLVEAVIRVVPELEESLVLDDGSFIEDVQLMVDEMRREYLERKEKIREEE